MLLPVSIVLLAATVYMGLQQDNQWIARYFDTISNSFTLAQHAPINATTTTTSRDWNLLYHLGGNGPWIPKVDGVVEGGLSLPEGCKIDQVHMVTTCSSCTFPFKSDPHTLLYT
jgi:hypothetical protein